ncbi:MAG: hypothetical protein COT81_04800 [Candidatus Buchananbacteria bacterium CG10_big_fil_rev_8_21_14_0_10_42_9]|uniref:Type II secretion system protein GspG C-terminal domain-containing protein n=1 Tax=Candidatus Buchananbacteria bacterium CG10_big_fil_rev_8_21_14_0_10_42_9 TaxID=1974526 RepID=A0A2H0W066_9BACT|nr:MAG: hypothetical protein COT81_04800 [Candidatus Buchananbacteria bacterium CG10_big_fil_rev_8_21_14_0_10_42_9]
MIKNKIKESLLKLKLSKLQSEGQNTCEDVGFTLLELLIVISIIAILSTILIIALNPAETLKKARDVQRLADLAAVKTAISIYITNATSTIYLSGDETSTHCQTTSGTYASGDRVYYSVSQAGTSITDTTIDGGTSLQPAPIQVATVAEIGEIDGSGWVPVNLNRITGGSPISAFPADPTNTISTAGAVTTSDLTYRYACQSTLNTFEIDARLESQAFTSDDNKHTTDGGNNSNVYESGTDLTIIGTGSDF